MGIVSLVIDGRKIEAKEGEYILNVARANGIFIPAICYMTRCSPTLACRLCIVEADGKRVYACNAKVKEGMSIITSTPELEQERKAIMQVYDINHPLQCGVCDQSGECELQNYTLEMGVDRQEYAIRDTKREIKNWGLIKYDPALCIVCERCITICNDMIGDRALKTVPRGGDSLPKELKDSMPKEAYNVWNRMQKNLIGASSGDKLECTFCGECIEVCPVGALTSSDFEYTTNAWELTQIPASCAHCSSSCHIYYEIKHTSISNPAPKIYRVTNEFHYVSLCGAGRFGYDFENKNAKRDEKIFEKLLEAFNKANTIIFDSFITNEEALILQKLKEKRGYRLVNKDAYAFKRFLHAYGKLYSANLADVHGSELIIVLGSMLKNDNPRVRYALNNALSLNKSASAIYLHPVGDRIISALSKNISCFKYEPLKELEVLKAIYEVFKEEEKDGFNELREKLKTLKEKQKRVLILGADCYSHIEATKIAILARKLEDECGFKILLIPSQTNTLGVALICDLDKEASGFSVGINNEANFVFGIFEDADVSYPALNQQEGTFSNIDKRVVPTYPALPYDGYSLAEVANELLGLKKRATIEYTKELPEKAGFKAIEFDSLPARYLNDGTEERGYLLDEISFSSNLLEESQKESFNFNEVGESRVVIYKANPVWHFSYLTNRAHQLKERAKIAISSEFAQKLGLKDDDTLEVSANNHKIALPVKIDSFLEGEILLIPDFDKEAKTDALFSSYRFNIATIRRAG